MVNNPIVFKQNQLMAASSATAVTATMITSKPTQATQAIKGEREAPHPLPMVKRAAPLMFTRMGWAQSISLA